MIFTFLPTHFARNTYQMYGLLAYVASEPSEGWDSEPHWIPVSRTKDEGMGTVDFRNIWLRMKGWTNNYCEVITSEWGSPEDGVQLPWDPSHHQEISSWSISSICSINIYWKPTLGWPWTGDNGTQWWPRGQRPCLHRPPHPVAPKLSRTWYFQSF